MMSLLHTHGNGLMREATLLAHVIRRRNYTHARAVALRSLLEEALCALLSHGLGRVVSVASLRSDMAQVVAMMTASRMSVVSAGAGAGAAGVGMSGQFGVGGGGGGIGRATNTGPLQSILHKPRS